MGYIGAIIAGIGQTIKLVGSATSSPNYPSPPKLYKLPVQKAKKQMEDYEQRRMDASIDAWKQRFPELYKGGQYEIDDIKAQQQGMLGGHIAEDMANSGLDPVHEGTNQYALSRDIGLSPLTLSQRTSQAVTRQIAQNPEWTNQITGGTLATMVANNYQNANAYGMMTQANRTAQYTANKAAGLYNTQALLGGITGAAKVGAAINNNYFSPLSPAGQGAYVPATATNAPYTTQYSPPPMGQPGSGTGSYSSWNAPVNSNMGMPQDSAMFQGGWNTQPTLPATPSTPDYSLYGNYYNPGTY